MYYEYEALYTTALNHESKLELSVKLKYFNLLSDIRAYKKIAIKTVVFDNWQRFCKLCKLSLGLKIYQSFIAL